MNEFKEQVKTIKTIPFDKKHIIVEKENQKYKKEIDNLKNTNCQLREKNNNLIAKIRTILKAIKKFFRKLLQIGNDLTKEIVSSEVMEYYDYNNFDMEDVKDIAECTTKEDELFDYADVPNYYRTDYNSDNDYKKNDDFEMSL